MTDITTLPTVVVQSMEPVTRMTKWAKEQGLVVGETWFFLGYSDRDTKLAFRFVDKSKAMLFKLTFGGL